MNNTLNEQQKKELAIQQGKICPYCGNPSVYTDSSVVYGTNLYGNIYWCQQCDAYVGVHIGTDRALGRLANKDLRDARKLAHHYFDQIARTSLIHEIWPEKIKNINSRNKAYLWLSKQLGIPLDDCHIGMFDLANCKRVVAICQALNHPAIKEYSSADTFDAKKQMDFIRETFRVAADPTNIDFDKLMYKKSAEEKNRMMTAYDAITKLGYKITFIDNTEIHFYFKNALIKLLPFKGWHTGETITDGIGLMNLISQIKRLEQ